MRSWAAPLLVVLAATLGGFAYGSLHLEPVPPSPRLAVEQRLMCPQCQEVRLDVCDRQICTDMKADIARRLAAGETSDSIVASYRTAYGSSVLSDSQPAGPASLLPWALLALGIAVLAALGWRRRGRVSTAPAAVVAGSLEAELAAWRAGR
jgi:cytochrome c-type biogenesis protein CcmH/NrfF